MTSTGVFRSRRYQSIVVSGEEAAQVERLRYHLAHGVKEGLVDRVKRWPGVHFAKSILGGKPLKGLWFNRTEEFAARNQGEDFGRLKYAEEEELFLSQLPCWADLTPEQYRERIAELVEEIEAEARADREARGVEPLGVGRRGDPAAGPPHPSKPDQEVAGTCLPCGDESCPTEFLGIVLRLRGRVPGGRGETQGGRLARQVPSRVVPARVAVRKRLRRAAAVGRSSMS